MDELYVGDIPLDFQYAVFSNGYITLYNQPSARGETLPYYRIYTNNNGFYYSTGETQFSSYSTTTFQPVNVTNSFWYRWDISGILVCTFVIAIFYFWIINLFTSIIRRGGILGGLF